MTNAPPTHAQQLAVRLVPQTIVHTVKPAAQLSVQIAQILARIPPKLVKEIHPVVHLAPLGNTQQARSAQIDPSRLLQQVSTSQILALLLLVLDSQCLVNGQR